MTDMIVELRKQVVDLDRELIKLLSERFKLTRSIGSLKHAAGLPAVDDARVIDFLRRWEDVASEHDVPARFITSIASHIHNLVVEDHKQRFPVDHR
ncbi:chorismate mutase [Brenneria izbisi]|uniref:chorismate mutase n=1 Tax=Brenneria izbisi TaxID=2939450 RepID=A0AA41XTP7_9GAMM|nr:chorismate mutase [Brenneria izbisi]MCV9877495.1 chorismate mutase [Brenneria izbisi]MCV9880939.1 chorismate mutase [Brenneria izbisi]